MVKSYTQHMSAQEKVLWVRLILSKGVGPTTFWKLMRNADGDAFKALSYVEDPCPEKTAENVILAHQKKDFSLICACEPEFPRQLKILNDCPPMISVFGSLALFQRRSIGIVGARNASLIGKVFAHKIADQLGQKNFVIVSGLARGIDSAAHEGSFKTGTIAVMSGGIDVVYPPENATLYTQILQNNGLVLSEMMPGTQIEPSMFPRRNRLIAALSEGVVLIEAAKQSGSLITARFALEQGKDIFVVPGSPVDPRSKGGNTLIKEGAYLIDSAEDILNVLSRPSEHEDTKILFPDPEEESPVPVDTLAAESNDIQKASLKDMILSELSTTPIAIEMLFQSQSFCSLPHLLTLISELEMEGKILRHANSQISLMKTH